MERRAGEDGFEFIQLEKEIKFVCCAGKMI